MMFRNTEEYLGRVHILFHLLKVTIPINIGRIQIKVLTTLSFFFLWLLVSKDKILKSEHVPFGCRTTLSL